MGTHSLSSFLQTVTCSLALRQLIQPEGSSYCLAHITIVNVKIFFLNASVMKNSDSFSHVNKRDGEEHIYCSFLSEKTQKHKYI